MEKSYASAKELKVGKYIIIDGEACKVVSIDKSKPGKHGAAKLRVVAIDIFNGSKKNWLGSTADDVEVPVIERNNAQVVSVDGGTAQLMDTKTFEIFELNVPEEMKGELEAGKEVELMESMGKKTIQRVIK